MRRPLDAPGNYDLRLRVGFSWLSPGEEGAKTRKRRRRSRGWTRDRWLRHFLPAERMPVHAPPMAPPVYEHAIWCNGSRHFPPGEPGHSCSCKSGPTVSRVDQQAEFYRLFDASRPVLREMADDLPLPSPPSDWVAGITTVQACRTLLHDAAAAARDRYPREVEVTLRAAARLLYHYMENALMDGMLEAGSRIMLDVMTKAGHRH